MNSGKIQNKKGSKKLGMSLIELLLYIGLLAGLIVVVSDAFISLSKGRGQSEARSEVNAAIRFSAEKIRQDIKGATVVVAPVLGTASSTLNITVGGTAVVYTVSGGQLLQTVGTASPTLVTGPGVFVNTLMFTRLENYNTQTSATTTSIQIFMSMKYNATSSDWTYSDNISTSASLR